MENKNEVYTNFVIKNKQAKEMLLDIQNFVQEAYELNIDISSTVRKKINNVIAMLDNDKLRIALIGGFSEGKTSIVAAWLGEYDKETMKINEQESSDSIQMYDYDNKYEIIDTPGLFGYKQRVTDIGEIEKFKDITKKYISEAHIIVYVMDPTNPIKESHNEELMWLFRKLDLLPRTVFVINKFDSIADIEDDDEYAKVLDVKKNNIIGRLKAVINLIQREENSLPIVGISANPYGEGIEYWLNRSNEFEKLSRIRLLRKAITDTIDRKGGFFPIVYEMQKSIIKDVLIFRQEEFKEELNKFQLLIDGLNEAKDIANNDLSEIKKEISIAKTGLRNFFISYFSELINKIRSCNPEDVQAFIDKEYGKNGCIIDSKVQEEIENRVSQVNERIKIAAVNFQAKLNQNESIFEMMGKNGTKFILNQTINNKNILFLRNGIVNLGKVVGVDLGKTLKFKPWGAKNLANKLNGALSIAGLMMEIFDLYNKLEEEKKFNKALEDVANSFSDAQAEMLELLNKKDFIERFFPAYIELDRYINQLESEIDSKENKYKSINNWYEKGKRLAEKYYEMN